jgi:predicted dehydrogenase
MKQVFLTGQGQTAVLDVPAPAPASGRVLVRNQYSLISSGTEGTAVTRNDGIVGVAEKLLASSERVGQVWNMARARGLTETARLIRNKLGESRPIGYSSAGVVIDGGGPDCPLQPGQRVACMGSGYANHAEFVSVPWNLVAAIGPAVPFELGAFGALGCIAIQGLRRLELSPGERVGIVGVGLIGQLALRLAGAMGYEAFGFDINQIRVEHAARHTTARRVIDSGACDPIQLVASVTGGGGLDGVLICAATDSDAPVNQAFELCRKRGRVSVVGDIGLGLERAKMYAKELELRMSCSYGPGRYDPAYEIDGRDYPLAYARWTEGRNLEYFVDLLAGDRLKISDLVSAKISIDEARAAYALIKAGAPETFGVLLDYGAEQPTAGADIYSCAYRPAMAVPTGRQVRIGLLGTGAYATHVHLPSLQRLPSVSIRATASKSGASAGVAARKAGAEYATSDYSRVLQDESIDAVIIATRHASHAELVLASLQAGKHVYVEKPMALTVADCVRIVEAQQRARVILRVGFNRRFSPYCRQLKQAVGGGQCLLNIRVNVGDVGAHWSNTAAEGGRLMGEGVHFVDLATWIFDAEPESVSAHFLGRVDSLNPNATIGIRYANGSAASIAYTTVGSNLAGKEYIELSGNGRTVIMNDYRTLSAYGCRVRATRAGRGDKGQRGAIAEFVSAVVSGESDCGADARAGLLATAVIAAAIDSARRREVVAIAPFIAAASALPAVDTSLAQAAAGHTS